MFQKMLLKNQNETMSVHAEEEPRLTRYGPEDARPEVSAHLTRFSRRHIREGAAQRVRDVTPEVAPEVAQTPTPVSNPAPKAPAEPHYSADQDLYSDAPISIGVLMRALPSRFEQARSIASDVFEQPEPVRKLA